MIPFDEADLTKELNPQVGYEALELEMANGCFGFGRWDAPYWFIGPEQGKGKDEPEDNTKRARAWHQLGRSELCDCLEFHAKIFDMSWHCSRPSLQRTWRPLMLLLMTFLNEPTNIESLSTAMPTCEHPVFWLSIRGHLMSASQRRGWIGPFALQEGYDTRPPFDICGTKLCHSSATSLSFSVRLGGTHPSLGFGLRPSMGN